MKKLFFIALSIFQIILLIFAYILNFLSRKKMGVMRHFIYKNNKLNDMYNIENIINILCLIIFLILIFAIINIVIFRKKKKLIYTHKKYFYIINISLILLGLIFIIFLKYFSIDKILTYYYISLIFLIVYIIEFIKAIIYSIKKAL